MFGNSFWEYKEKNFFFCIFEIKNMFGQLKLKIQFFEEKNRKY